MYIILMLEAWFLTFLIEGLLYSVGFLWKLRRLVAALNAIVIAASSVWLCSRFGGVLAVLFGLLAGFRVLNMLRIIKNRMHSQYLLKAVSRTSVFLFLFHVLVVLAFAGSILVGLPLRSLQFLQAAVASGIFVVTLGNIAKLRFRPPNKFLVERELPTVTVAIPARNETRDLQECLRSLLNSDYPKLEIIVLDDCSRGKTADIIKSFAQSGVRFVPGQPPADRWLAKNQAYHQLTEEANGELILFCGVDVRFGEKTVRDMVNLLVARKKSMLSVLPLRSRSSVSDAFIQPMRYWWELALPRRIFNKPPVLSTCWMIHRQTLEELGGFKAVHHAILPEAHFARELVKADKYSFVRSSGELEVKTTKSFREQYNTAIRTRYPQIRRRPETAFLLTIANLTFLCLPFLFLAMSFWTDIFDVALAAVTCGLLVGAHVAIVKTSDPRNTLSAFLSFPIAAVSELIIGYTSMIQYEFFTVNWKERNICIPVMHVIPRLPKITEE